MDNQNHPLAFLFEATLTAPNDWKAVLKNKFEQGKTEKSNKDAEQIAANKKLISDDEKERQRVLDDFEKDEISRGKIAQLGDTDDFVEDPTGAVGTFKPAVPDQETTLDPEGWEPGEDELTGKEGPIELEPELSTSSKMPEALIDFRIRLVSRIITLDEIKRLEKLIRANEAPKPKLVKAKGPWVDHTPKPTLDDLLTALKKMVFYLTESPSAPVRLMSGLTDSIKSLQKVIALLLPKE